MVEFESKDDDEAESLLYLAKILTLYEDVEGNLKVLVHFIEYKQPRGVEATFSDSRLVQHYRLEFVPGNGKPRVYSVPVNKIQHLTMTYRAIEYMMPLPPPVRNTASQHKHTVMIVKPQSKWARLFLQWTSELKD
jgi:hypothetical protein